MSDHKSHQQLATAAILDLSSRGRALQAAVLRNAPHSEIEKLRSEAHDLLDAYLDHETSAARSVRAILGD